MFTFRHLQRFTSFPYIGSRKIFMLNQEPPSKTIIKDTFLVAYNLNCCFLCWSHCFMSIHSILCDQNTFSFHSQTLNHRVEWIIRRIGYSPPGCVHHQKNDVQRWHSQSPFTSSIVANKSSSLDGIPPTEFLICASELVPILTSSYD